MTDGQSFKNTNGIMIEVNSEYLPSHSRPNKNLWFYIYHVKITNLREDTVQRMSRHWIITNAEGEVQHVQGDGVVGEQPILKTNEHFTYTSACPLNTPFGSMHGSYLFRLDSGADLQATIAPFFLSISGMSN